MAKLKDDADRVAHVLRRLSFGASVREREAFKGMSVDAVVDQLVNPSGKDSELDPLRFAFIKERDAQPTSYRFRNYWVHEMIVSDQPLREKMGVFWHNHFAVSEGKTEDGLAMLEYLKNIRREPLG
ncbi:MAG: DUF1800 family protein, partial [Armatimonadota bacterium]